MNTIINRIKEIADNEGITITALEKKLGASKGVFSRPLNTGTDIQSKWVTLVVENYPRYNAEWLLTGKGDMLGVSVIESNPIKGSTDLKTTSDLKSIPIVDIEVAAGLGRYNHEHIDVMGHLTLPSNSLQRRDARYYAIRSRGQSMTPTIFDKDWLIIRYLEQSEWQSLRDEYIYVVVDKDGKSYIKRIKDRLSRGFIVCMSDNIDKANYPNFSLDESEIYSLFYVEFKLSPHLPNVNTTYYDRMKLLEDRVDELETKICK